MLLHVIANPRAAGQSRSRRVATAFLEGFRSTHPDEPIEELDLFSVDLPMIDALDVNARVAQSRGGDLSPEERARFDRFWTFIDPLLKADRVVVTTPMWNFGPPWKLKQWLDVVTQSRVTFEYGPTGPRGLLRAKGALLGSRGGPYADGDPRETHDFLVPALRWQLGWLGITDLTVIMADALDAAPQSAEAVLRAAAERARAAGAAF